MTEDPQHVPNGTRIAFRAASPQDVDRIAAVIEGAGARHLEGPGLVPEYGPTYYGVFFDDPEGNKLEVCFHAE